MHETKRRMLGYAELSGKQPLDSEEVRIPQEEESEIAEIIATTRQHLNLK